MKTIERKVYHCEYCKYYSLSGSSTSRHEKYCRNKPENMHKCFDYCAHLKRERVDTGYDEDNFPISKTLFTCEKTNRKMYSYIAEKKGIVDKLNKGTIRMPLACNLFSNMDNIDTSDN